MEIDLSALAKDLHVQMCCSPEEVSGLQNNSDAITRLHLHGLLTESETYRARERLVKKIVVKLKQLEKKNGQTNRDW